MTSPSQQQQQQQTAAETSAVVPVLLSVLAAYLATKPSVSGSWQVVSTNLGLMDLAGNALTNTAERSLERLYRNNPSDTAKFDTVKAQAITEGVNAGLHELVDVLKAIAPESAASRAASRSSIQTPGRSELPGRKEGGAAGSSESLAIPASRAIPKPLRSRITPAELQWTAANLAESVGNAAVVYVADKIGWDKVWHSQGDSRVRSTHNVLNGVRISAAESFHTPEGTALRYPHDPLAPLSEIAGCRCWITVMRPRRSS